MKSTSGRLLLAAGLMATGVAHAAGGAGFKIFGGDFAYNGFFRLELAAPTNGHRSCSQVNQFCDPMNGRTVHREAGNPADGYQTVLDPTTFAPTGLGDILNPLTGQVLGAAGQSPRGVTNSNGVSDDFTRYVPKKTPDMNYHILRFEATPSLRWGNVSLITRVRALYDPGSLGYRDFDPSAYDDINGGFKHTSAPDRNYTEKPNYLGYSVNGSDHPMWFEISDRNYMVDLPAFILQWTDGSTTVRVGNQSVAWGQLLFFRVMDVANGLDTRRHLILDRGLEEYADERMSAPGIRITQQVTDQIVADAFVQQFIPTILPGPNTPYNPVPTQFIVHDRYHENGNDKDVNYGIRLKADYGKYTWQAMYTRRYNQLGRIRWTKSEINKPLPNSNLLGAAFNQYCEGVLGSPLGQGCGPQLAQTAFEASPAGVFAAEEWFNYAGYVKLHANHGLDTAVNDFPAAQQLLASPTYDNPVATNNELDAFFMASEGLHGHIERDYHPEDVFGLGGGYVLDAEPGSIFDQMIFNVEATYTTNRWFTPVDLRQAPDTGDDAQIGLVIEKYQRFSTAFPATYLVFQYLWQKETDLLGLRLDGYGSENFSDQGVVLNKNVPTNANPRIAPGLNSANYVVFAFLQPWPSYIYSLGFASLIDVQGGVLIQPSLQWKPRGDTTVDLFYNYVNDKAWGDNANRNLMSWIYFANEVSLRVGFQF